MVSIWETRKYKDCLPATWKNFYTEYKKRHPGGLIFQISDDLYL